MNLKIYHKSAIIWNVILFILLSFVFVYLSNAVYFSESIFKKSFLTSFVNSNKFLIGYYALTVLLTYRLSKKSRLFFVLSSLLTVSFISYQLFNDFSKLILLILFLFIIVSYYIYYFLSSELSESYYNPLYSAEDLFDPMLKKFKCNISWDESNLSAYFTNWSSSGFFIFVEGQSKGKVPKLVDVEIKYEGIVFKCRAKVVSKARNNKGFGLKVLETNNEENSDTSWFGFYEIIDKMGYHVEYLK